MNFVWSCMAGGGVVSGHLLRACKKPFVCSMIFVMSKLCFACVDWHQNIMVIKGLWYFYLN